MLGDDLKMCRIREGATQQEIADLLRIDRSTYSYYESGKLQPPFDVIAKLSSFYGVRLDPTAPKNTNLNFSAPSVPIIGAPGMNEPVGFFGLDPYDEEDEDQDEAFDPEEARLLAQIRARSCTEQLDHVLKTLESDEIDDDVFLSFLVDPDEV